ncbi:MAG: C-GCAxxG-C-C family protein, partial [Deltaproteobacteria bacterium]|nr:C-GCAxxG-C-C family protein [Deltaproteobacteria bacterium]
LLGLEDRQILKAATGLGGGIGHEGDTCGALTGGILSLGLFYRGDDYHRLYRDCAECYRRFKVRSGSTKCMDIIGVKLNQDYDIRRFFLKGIRCLKVVFNSIESVFDIIQKPDEGLPSGDRHQIRPPFDIGGFHCASAVLSRIEPQLNLNLASILKISRGFSGGIAFQGDICGALMGGVLALGIIYGTELQSTKPVRFLRTGLVAMQQGSRVFQHEDLHPSFRASLRVSKLYREFVSQFGSTDCTEILSKANKSKNSHFCKEIAQSTSDLTLDLINA